MSKTVLLIIDQYQYFV